METKSDKNHRVSFLVGQKETFLSRLRELVAGRALQQAADEWGVPKSTLNNYFYRGSNPRAAIVRRIAEKENVNFDWLVGLTDKKLKRVQQQQQPQHILSSGPESPLQAIVAILATLEADELSNLSKLLGRKGAEVLALLLEQGSLDLLNLSGEKRDIALIIKGLPPARAREILLEIKQCDLHEEKIEHSRQASA